MAEKNHTGVDAQAVMWRFRDNAEYDWLVSEKKPSPSWKFVEPLYATQPPAAPVETKSAPAVSAAQNIAEGLRSSDAATAGADTQSSDDNEDAHELRRLEDAQPG